MNVKTMAVLGTLILSASAMQAQTPTTRPVDSAQAMNKAEMGKSAMSTTGTTMDINTASRSELAAAGWGQYSDAIIAGRPYKSMNDLVEKKMVPQAAYDKGYEKFQIGNGTASPMGDAKPMADPTLSPTTPSTNPATPTTTGPVTTPTPGAAGAYPSTPAAARPSDIASPAK